MANYEEIVTYINGPTLVLAGPGAGKTYLLGDRVKRLLDSGVPESKITVLTFGRDAKQNMRNKLLDPNDGFGIPYEKLPKIATLNSFGNEIVNKIPRIVGLRKTNLKVQGNDAAKRLLFRDAALLVGLSEEKGIRASICKQSEDCSAKGSKEECLICEKYWEIMAACNYLDYDDQILLAIRILQEDSTILNSYQESAEHLLVDEYQDINAAQFLLIEMLSRNSRNGLFVVGDDAQSIYGFRGSDPGFILRFSLDYKGAFTPPLAHSRRCHEKIINDANKILQAFYPNWTGPYDLEYHIQPMDPPVIRQTSSEIAEAELVARIARKAVGEKKSVLVLAPKKAFFSRISKTLVRYGVPHTSPVNLLTESVNKRIESVIPFFEWIGNRDNNFILRRLIEELINKGAAKVPGSNKNRKIKPETLQKRQKVETEIARLWERVDRKHSLLEAITTASSAIDTIAIIKNILEGLIQSYDDPKGDNRGEFSKKLAIASGVWIDPVHYIEDLKSVVNLISSPKPLGFGAVQLMTMRKAKGLEADVVVMVGLEDDIIPNPNSEIEEEARLFYVSMTRAKEKLYLLHSFKRPRSISFGPDIMRKNRSRFLDALGRESKYFKKIVSTA